MGHHSYFLYSLNIRGTPWLPHNSYYNSLACIWAHPVQKLNWMRWKYFKNDYFVDYKQQKCFRRYVVDSAIYYEFIFIKFSCLQGVFQLDQSIYKSWGLWCKNLRIHSPVLLDWNSIDE